MMNNNNVWSDLKIPEEGALTLRIIDKNVSRRWSWAKDSDSFIGIAIELNNDFFNFSKIIKTKILKISYQPYGSINILSVLCSKNELFEILNIFCLDLIRDTQEIMDDEFFAHVLIERINAWCNLFQRENKRLKHNQILGLAAELTFLKYWIEKKNQSISGWLGPENESQDFVSNDQSFAFEVKLSNWEPETIHISSLNQLNFDGKLNLVVYPGKICEEDETNAINLKYLIELAKNVVPASEYQILLNKLLLAGYAGEIDDKTFFLIANPLSYEIKDDFPRISKQQISTAIIDCNYKLSLRSLDIFKVPLE